MAWSVLEPRRTFVPGWHIDAMCEHLEAVSRGEIQNLLINVPPGFMKSLLVDVLWPAWEWGPLGRPDLRYVSSSYNEALTIRDNRRTRGLIQSPFYQALWGNTFRLVGDQNEKRRFDTNHKGYKIATSVGGLGTGERADRFLIDDPHNVRDAESDPKRESVLLWLNETVPTRLNDPDISAIVMIMQRVHARDSSGEVLARDLGYTHLCIPMEYDPEYSPVTPYFTDPRRKKNELAWPARFSRERVEKLKQALGTYAVSAQFQQQPAPRGGGLFKREWFEVVGAAPARIERSVRGWDLAASETDTAKYTAGVRISIVRGFYYIEDVVRLRGSPEKVERALVNTASQDSRSTVVDIPQDPGQAGKSQVRYLKGQLAGYIVHSSPESGDKKQRAEAFASQAEAGNVKLVRGDWNETYLDELCNFPRGEFSDQVDATSRAFSRLIQRPMHEGIAAPEVVTVG